MLALVVAFGRGQWGYLDMWGLLEVRENWMQKCSSQTHKKTAIPFLG